MDWSFPTMYVGWGKEQIIEIGIFIINVHIYELFYYNKKQKDAF